MKNRCCNPNADQFPDYGGRGIVVCEHWLESFENFLADMGERPPGTTIDRINCNGNYEPSNCRWATVKEQCRNKRKNHRLNWEGRDWALAELAERYNHQFNTLAQRLKKGWELERALLTPTKHKSNDGG